MQDLGANDAAVRLARTNDIAKNEGRKMTTVIRRRLQGLLHTRVIVFNVPHRYDSRRGHVLTKQLKKQTRIGKICKYFKNVSPVDISKLGCRFHAKQVLHLNDLGKRHIADKILEIFQRPDMPGRSLGVLRLKNLA